MPVLTRWMLKTSLLYLVFALLAGVAQPLAAALPGLVIPPGIRAVYLHLFMVGWVTLLIFGVVYWMFPKYSREQPRGSEALGWAAYVLLNAGLLLRALGELQLGQGTVWGWVLVLSAVLQWLGGAAFVANTWPRVKEK